MINMAMIFPGQNYQNVFALLLLSKKNRIIKKTFLEASEYLNENIWKYIEKPNHFFQKNKYIQPFILTASVSIYRLWKQLGGINPIIAAGHSLGEYSALVCSNAIKFSDAIQLVKKREILMHNIIQNQSVQMKAIIGLQKSTILKICKKNSLRNIVNIASINPCKQIIISGHKEAVEKTSIECKNQGAKKIITLTLNLATHCSIMKKIKRPLLKKIKKISIKSTDYCIINSITVTPQHSKHTIRNSLIKQLYKPVLWEKTMNFIKKKSSLILEVGTSNILTTLNKQFPELKSIAINKLHNIQKAFNLLKKVL
ncbi:ACP S-malonyltransferase [Buchnera aphidicola]|uniref:ACP S-malonyltransferase n=1 Tax=Buchnera aphidicola TaxID=9 RepID=UPI003463ED2F